MADVLQIKLETTGDGKVRASLAGVSRELDSVDGNARAAGGAMDLLKTAAAAFSALELARYIYDVNARFDNLDARLRVATGSAENAQAVMSALEGHFSGMPVTLEETAGAFIRLKNLGLDPSRQAIESYANTAAAMGTDLTQFIEAVADASVMEFERLKEFGIKASQQGEQVTFTFQGVRTTVQKDAAAIENYLQQIGNVQFAGSLDAQAETLGGATKIMIDELDKLTRSITGSDVNGLMLDAAGGVATLAREIRLMINDPSSMPEWMKTTAFIAHELGRGIEELGTNMAVLAGILSVEIGTDMFEQIGSIWDSGRQEFERLEQESQDFVARLEGIRTSVAQVGQDAADRQAIVFSAPNRPTGGLAAGSAGGSGSSAAAAELDDMDRALDLVIQQFEDLDEAEARAIAGLEKFTNGVGALGSEIQQAEVVMQNLMSQSDRMWQGMSAAAEGWGDDLASTLAHAAVTGKASFSDLAQSIARDILMMYFKMQLIEPLLGSMQGYFSGNLSAAGVTGMESAGAISGGRASGGPVYGGETYLVGERGPELLTMGGNGYVTPNNMLGSSGAPPNMPVRVIINNQGQPKQAEARTEFDAEGAVVRVFLSDVDRGGPMSGALAGKFGLQQRVG